MLPAAAIAVIAYVIIELRRFIGHSCHCIAAFAFHTLITLAITISPLILILATIRYAITAWHTQIIYFNTDYWGWYTYSD